MKQEAVKGGNMADLVINSCERECNSKMQGFFMKMIVALFAHWHYLPHLPHNDKLKLKTEKVRLKKWTTGERRGW